MAPKRHPDSAGQRKATAKSTNAALGRKRKADNVAADETAESSKRSHRRQKGEFSYYLPCVSPFC